MAKPSNDAIVRALLVRYPRTYLEELGVKRVDTPTGLFANLLLSLLMSARISSNIALEAARALRRSGWTSAEKMAESTWEERAATLNESGYARYDERTSTMLGETCDLLIDRYRGDLRRLRDEAGEDPSEERKLLKELKGIGDVGVDIFFREVQGAWTELHPFVDQRARAAAQKLGLPGDAGKLAKLAPKGDLVRLSVALVRTDLDGAVDDVREEAA